MIEKRGQFFLVAALVISGILIGLAGIYTEVNAPKEDLSVQDLSVELNYESLQVIDQGVYADLTDEQLFENVANLTDYYAAKNPGSEFIVMYGNKDYVKLRQYSPKEVGSIGLGAGGVVKDTVLTGVSQTDTEGQEVVGQRVCVNAINGQSYCANTTIGRSFATVITFNKNDETYVSKTTSGAASLTEQPRSSNNLGQCSGSLPTGEGIRLGDNEYLKLTSTDTRQWTYVEPSTLLLQSCTWTCRYNSEAHYVVNSARTGCVSLNPGTNNQ